MIHVKKQPKNHKFHGNYENTQKLKPRKNLVID